MRIRTSGCFAAAALLAGCGFYDKPPAADAAEAVESFLVAAYARDCAGRVEVRRLTVSRVGDYRSDYDGFPVFAAVEVGCADGTTLPHLAARSGREDVVAFVKRVPPLMKLTAFLPPRLRTERERDETRAEAAETRGMPR